MRIEVKRALIKHNYERPGLSQRELAAWAKVQFKLKNAPAQTTVSDILKHAATIMDEAYGDGKRRKPLRVASLRLEKRLWAWLQELEPLVKPLGKNPYDIDQLQAMEWSREIWDAMQKQRTIRNCFAHTGICFRGVNEESSGNRDESSVEDVINTSLVDCQITC
ncbi:hypothetical protein PI124_g561 [Phytophthora idaei]|nr:hypothetical protein PI125_g9870 [Phytophthora idaei]KAG3152325.1 hypothetical protein PI126_g10573 [Phytophthora idaei]KAG3254931.1 hypothetical protein PI124_g561 [Phytophthora idaei]